MGNDTDHNLNPSMPSPYAYVISSYTFAYWAFLCGLSGLSMKKALE